MLLNRMWAALLFMLLAASLAGSSCSAAQEPVARVNEKMIARQELDHFIKVMRLCNPDLDRAIEDYKDESEMRKVELEFLQILVDVELVKQEVERLSLVIDPADLQKNTEVLLGNLVQTHYGGSTEQFDRKRKQLRVGPEDLMLIPKYELQLQALFDYLSASLTAEDLIQYVEENPELLQQAASLDVFYISYSEESEARLGLEKLQQGVPVEAYIEKLQTLTPGLEAGPLGWVTADNPFVEPAVIELLFSRPQEAGGSILKLGDRFNLYWVREARPAAVLGFEDVKGQAYLRKQHILYRDYFYALWSEGQIEILLKE